MVYTINGCREHDYKSRNTYTWRMIRLKRGPRKKTHKTWIEYKPRTYGTCIGHRHLEHGYGITQNIDTWNIYSYIGH